MAVAYGRVFRPGVRRALASHPAHTAAPTARGCVRIHAQARETQAARPRHVICSVARMADARFDADALIAEFGDETLIAELAQLLLDHADEQLGALHAAIADGNASALKSAAHKIKGGMGTFGATAVTKLAMALEAIGRDGRLSDAPPMAAALDAEVRALCESARVWLADRAA